MTKSELIEQIARNYSQLPQKDIELAVNQIIDSVIDALAAGQRIEVRGFGSFSLNYRKSRVARNPKTGESLMLPEKRVPHFKPGKQLRDGVNDARDENPIDC